MGFVRRIGLSLALAGIDPRAVMRAVNTVPQFARDVATFNKAARSLGHPKLRYRSLLPALTDRVAQAGSASSEYFLGDLWVARRIHERRPARHLDVGSRIDGLVAHLLTFIDVDVVDIRLFTIDGVVGV